ncbi:hemerythrin domain-containing protein [Streptomyces narbonensis]|uniref:hemerythrin domain-containing protein n=1 Tax=Streptomyces narbonensis TaxID=67333 RepID=UPI001E62733A|nr:hemerythrin domain-containing protein [Streptomyces narbonensis]
MTISPMCHYCGCREIPLIKEFIAEHEAITDLAGDAVRALDAGDREGARTLVERMAVLLLAHWSGEERGLFAVMRENEEYTAYVDALAAEHRELAAFLARLDLGSDAQRAEFVRAVDELHDHIAKEEDGLFPASLTELTGEQWNRSFDAWRAVHAR